MTLRDSVEEGEEQEQPEVQPSALGSEFRVHAIDAHGYWINWRIVAGTSQEQLNELVQRQGQLSNWLQAHNYQPDSFGISVATNQPARVQEQVPFEGNPDYPACPDCGGPTEHKTGTAKNGRPWSGYFCIRTKDAPKNGRHTATFI